jgi:hypothetical protein
LGIQHFVSFVRQVGRRRTTGDRQQIKTRIDQRRRGTRNARGAAAATK